MPTPANHSLVGSASSKSLRRRWIVRIAKAFCVLIVISGLFPAVAFVLARIPVNRGFQHASDQGVEILLVNNGVHVDLIIPLDESCFPMRPWLGEGNYRSNPQNYSHAMVGWGNRKFYLETKTWGDLKLSNVLYAFCGLGETTVHVDLMDGYLFRMTTERQRLIRLSPPQFQALCTHIVATLKKDKEGGPIPIACEPYGNSDSFFEGVGNYHIFRTCNVWVAEGLKVAGVRVGVWTVTPDSLFACLPENAPMMMHSMDKLSRESVQNP